MIKIKGLDTGEYGGQRSVIVKKEMRLLGDSWLCVRLEVISHSIWYRSVTPFSFLGDWAAKLDIWSLFMSTDKQKSSVCNHTCIVRMTGNGEGTEQGIYLELWVRLFRSRAPRPCLCQRTRIFRHRSSGHSWSSASLRESERVKVGRKKLIEGKKNSNIRVQETLRGHYNTVMSSTQT